MKELYTPLEVAGLFGVSRATIYKWLRRGLIKANRLPGEWQWRVTRAEVNRLREKLGLGPLPEDQ